MSLLRNPYLAGGTARKVGIHNHVDFGTDDGSVLPAALAALCATAGMDAFAITSHDTFANHKAAFDAEGVLWLPSVESTAINPGQAGPHTTCIGIATDAATEISTNYQTNPAQQVIIDQTNADSGFATIAHANLQETYGISLEDILLLTGYHAIEVAGPMVRVGFYGNAEVFNDGSYSSINIADAVLTAVGFKVLTCVSDFHSTLVDPGAETVYVDQGYQVVYSDALTIAGIVANLKSGNSYATMKDGVVFSNAPVVVGQTAAVNTDAACTCEWIKENGIIAQSDSSATSFSFTVTDETYIRAKLILVSDTTKIAYAQAMEFDPNLMLTYIETVATEVYDAYDGNVFSSDGVNYYRAVNEAAAVSVPAIGLTSY